MTNDDLAGLNNWIRREFGHEAHVSELDKGTAGFSNETWLLTVSQANGETLSDRHLVLRKPREEIKFFPSYDIRLQYDILESLRDTSVPAPVPVVMESDPDYIGTPFYLMERIAPGSGVVPYDGPPSGIHGMGLFHDASTERRRRLWNSAVEAIAVVHTIEPARTPLPFGDVPMSLRDVVDKQLAVIEQWYRFGSTDPLPAIEAAIKLLRDEVPEQHEIVLCWGDPKPGNIVYRDDDVVGVLDWEMSHLGTPEMDVMYWIITDDVSASTFNVPRLDGCPGRDETIAHYERVSGRTLQNLDYHEAFQTLRLAVLLILADRVVTEMGMAEHFPDNWSTNNEPYRRLQALT